MSPTSYQTAPPRNKEPEFYGEEEGVSTGKPFGGVMAAIEITLRSES